MPAAAVPETDLRRIRTCCDAWGPPPELHDRIRVEMRRRGKSVTFLERSPLDPSDPEGEWFEVKVAQLRYDGTDGWTLYWPDRHGRWHRYDLLPPGQPVMRLLDEIERDPTNIFWG